MRHKDYSESASHWPELICLRKFTNGFFVSISQCVHNKETLLYFLQGRTSSPSVAVPLRFLAGQRSPTIPHGRADFQEEGSLVETCEQRTTRDALQVRCEKAAGEIAFVTMLLIIIIITTTIIIIIIFVVVVVIVVMIIRVLVTTHC